MGDDGMLVLTATYLEYLGKTLETFTSRNLATLIFWKTLCCIKLNKHFKCVDELTIKQWKSASVKNEERKPDGGDAYRLPWGISSPEESGR